MPNIFTTLSSMEDIRVNIDGLYQQNKNVSDDSPEKKQDATDVLPEKKQDAILAIEVKQVDVDDNQDVQSSKSENSKD